MNLLIPLPRTQEVQCLLYFVNYRSHNLRNDVYHHTKSLLWLFTENRKKLAFLDLLIAASTNSEIDDQGIKEEVNTFIAAVSKIKTAISGRWLIILDYYDWF